jgi:hypothetical protein
MTNQMRKKYSVEWDKKYDIIVNIDFTIFKFTKKYMKRSEQNHDFLLFNTLGVVINTHGIDANTILNKEPSRIEQGKLRDKILKILSNYFNVKGVIKTRIHPFWFDIRKYITYYIQIPSKMTGGRIDYFMKYIKYKKKYIKLQNKLFIR